MIVTNVDLPLENQIERIKLDLEKITVQKGILQKSVIFGETIDLRRSDIKQATLTLQVKEEVKSHAGTV